MIRAGLRQSVDAKRLAKLWTEHNTIKDAAGSQSAREWLRIHIVFNKNALKSALDQTHASGWVLGSDIAKEHLGVGLTVNWDTWQAGNEAAAALIDPQGKLADLLNGNADLVDQLDETTLNRIGTALSDGLEFGYSYDQVAAAINDVLDDPLRSMVIARTETSRALNESSVADYKSAGIEMIEWQGADPCAEICDQNDGEIIALGDTFSSGDEYPPAHPNCICTTLPVIPEGGIDTSALEAVMVE